MVADYIVAVVAVDADFAFAGIVRGLVDDIDRV